MLQGLVDLSWVSGTSQASLVVSVWSSRGWWTFPGSVGPPRHRWSCASGVPGAGGPFLGLWDLPGIADRVRLELQGLVDLSWVGGTSWASLIVSVWSGPRAGRCTWDSWTVPGHRNPWEALRSLLLCRPLADVFFLLLLYFLLFRICVVHFFRAAL